MRSLFQVLRPVLVANIASFCGYPDLVGVVILGGASLRKQSLDQHSDLDASIFVSVPDAAGISPLALRSYIDHSQDRLPQWLPDFSQIVQVPAHPLAQVEINIHQQIYEIEVRSDVQWDEAKKQSYAASGEIFYDPHGLVRRLIGEKIRWNDEDARRVLLRILGQAKWYGMINPRRQLDRGSVLSAMNLLADAADLLIHALFLVNREYRPHTKWRIDAAIHLPLLPPDFPARISTLYHAIVEAESIIVRTEVFEALLEDVTEIARREYSFTGDPYRLSCYESFLDRQLLRRNHE